jgi:hypothetical protein
LVLADIDPPGKRGLKLIKELRSVDPSVKLLVVSRHNEAVYVARVMRLGGDGYVMKQGDPDEIVFAIHDVLKGCIYISEEVMERPGEEGEARISEGEFVHGIAPRIPSLRSWNWLEMARTDAKRHSDSELTGSRFIALNPPPKAFGRTGRQ